VATGLIALLDDVAAIAKVAAASLDDVAAQAGKAGTKALGIVVDDAAVTPRYVVGFAADRELPIIWKIARGSFFNKLVILLPAALGLSLLAPWAITPLLMLGGLYLCFEGFEKVAAMVGLHHEENHAVVTTEVADARALEDEKVASAIRTDFILSAEIMAIALAAIAAAGFWTKVGVLAVVGLGMTTLVYGAVALIVKADDAGVALSRRGNVLARGVGAALVRGMPPFLAALSVVGAFAMLWVGGGILLHGLEAYGVDGPYKVVHGVAEAVAGAMPALRGFVSWLVEASIAAVIGFAVGALVAPLATKVIGPLAKRIMRKRAA
jgi:hypothetical protein